LEKQMGSIRSNHSAINVHSKKDGINSRRGTPPAEGGRKEGA
jgi:hypothetical protein